MRELNTILQMASPVLAPLHFRGGYVAPMAPANEPIASADTDADLAFFGSRSRTSHVLVVNRDPTADRQIELSLRPGTSWLDGLDGRVLAWETDRAAVDVEAGGFRLLAIKP